MSQKVNVELEKPPSGGKQRKLRSVQSADSLLLESNNGQQTYPSNHKLFLVFLQFLTCCDVKNIHNSRTEYQK